MHTRRPDWITDGIRTSKLTAFGSSYKGGCADRSTEDLAEAGHDRSFNISEN